MKDKICRRRKKRSFSGAGWGILRIERAEKEQNRRQKSRDKMEQTKWPGQERKELGEKERLSTSLIIVCSLGTGKSRAENWDGLHILWLELNQAGYPSYPTGEFSILFYVTGSFASSPWFISVHAISILMFFLRALTWFPQNTIIALEFLPL